MNVAVASAPSTGADPSDRPARALRLAAAAVAVWLLVTAWPMWRWWSASHEAMPPALHLAALTLAVVAASRRLPSPQLLRDWLPLLLGPFLYIELRWLVPGAGRPHADAMIIAWEHAVFRGDPSAALAPRLPSLALSELLHLCYASYYLLVFVPPVLLYRAHRRTHFARTMLALAIVYAACFATYLLLPVDGPRYLVGPALAPTGPIRAFVLQLLAAGSSRGTAFPSSHIAASVVASLCALGADRRIGIPVALLTVGLTVATVYGGFHYGIDAIAGVLTGFAAWALSRVAWAALGNPVGYEAPGETSASAPA